MIEYKHMSFWASFRKHIINILLYLALAIVFLILIVTGNALYDDLVSSDAPPPEEVITDKDAPSSYSCNVTGIDLHGTLVTYVPSMGGMDDFEAYQTQYGDAVGSENIIAAIRRAVADESVKAIVLEIDSGGGSPVAGEEIAQALKDSFKPTVVVIRQGGLSSAYWAATGAKRIFASKNSDVGSIGVTSSYLENIDTDTKYIQLSSGKFKDSGDPDKPITEEEKRLFMRDINIIYENFISDVSTNRSIPKDEVRAIADGSSVLGEAALSLKLIDEIGGWKEAETYLEQLMGEKPVVCW